MAITFDCPECMQPLQVPDNAAGQRTACPRCNTQFRVPHPPPAAVVRPPPRPAPPRAAVASPPSPPPVRRPVARVEPAPAPTPAAPTPQGLPAAPPPPAERGGSWLVHLWPVGVLCACLVTVIVHDLLRARPSPARTTEPPAPVVDATPRLALKFHEAELVMVIREGGMKSRGGREEDDDGEQFAWEPGMRFGLVVPGEKDPQNPGEPKRLTYRDNGTTNNTCIRLDGNEWIFGDRPFRRLSDNKSLGDEPGRWLERQDTDLGQDSSGRPRQGTRSVWYYDREKVKITQTVEVVLGEQSGLLDTCLVVYQLENTDDRPHRVGLRFLLDTFIGGNDGVPFTIPGESQLCDTRRDFNRPQDVPDFIQALENEDLANPGTIAHLQLRLGSRLEAPSRVTLGAYPASALNRLDRRCLQQYTLWDVPVLPIKSLPPGDSAVTLYWEPRELAPGARRELGFTYGLGNVSSGEGRGQLLLTAGGSVRPGDEFPLTALVSHPAPGQTVTLTLPEGFTLAEGTARQEVPPVPAGSANRNSPVTWRVRSPDREGRFSLRVESSTGPSQAQEITLRKNRIFD